jgi:Phosphotransferase enzyme family
MVTILDTGNVFEYLATLDYCKIADRDTSTVTIIPAKNFNLLITFADGKNLLVKQELHNDLGQTKQEFRLAWRIQELVTCFPDFSVKIAKFLPKLLYFNPEHSILIVEYLSTHIDLADYHTNENKFPIAIATSIGQVLATLHSQTFEQIAYNQFWDRQSTFITPDLAITDARLCANDYANEIIQRLSRITPHVFRIMPVECLQFFKLYQRFPSLSQAIFDLGQSIAPSCLVHNDLKTNNILLDLNWDSPKSQVIKLIDWERAGWGDPAFDLGCMLGSYVEIWLDGLIISNSLSINESLQLTATPLELIQPFLFSLVQSYLEGFTAITIARPDYLDRVVQFAGLALIQRIEINIDEDRIFGNRGIVMLQVAKQLLCTPQAAMSTLFGREFNQLIKQ